MQRSLTETLNAYRSFVNDATDPDFLPQLEGKNYKNNNLIGAIANHDNFIEFKTAFKRRIQLLYQHFKGNEHNLKVLKDRLVEIATVGWSGPYSEITAYYEFINNDLSNLELDVNNPKESSYAAETRHEETNGDIKLIDFDAYCEVKRFGHTHSEIINKIISEIEKDKQRTDSISINILPEINTYIPEKNTENIFKALKEELSVAVEDIIKNQLESSYLHSKELKGLGYRIKLNCNVNSAISEYSPKQRAENLRHMVLSRYTYKIMKQKPFYFVFVNFPWFNQIDRDSFESNKILYSDLAQFTFFQYKDSLDSIQDIITEYQGEDTLFEISRHISGLIFIDDKAILDTHDNCYLFLNPNSINKDKDLEDILKKKFIYIPFE